jgi:hypothetical protein
VTTFSEPLIALESFTANYRDLFKDARLYKGFQATITGILCLVSRFSASGTPSSTVFSSNTRILCQTVLLGKVVARGLMGGALCSP